MLPRRSYKPTPLPATSVTPFRSVDSILAQLVLELTETTVMRDTETIVARLGELKAMGVRIAIDDFGTGFSSLARLRQFPIDILKIDRSFISQCEDSDMPSTFVRAIVQLGKTLGLEVVAEGIETAAHWADLTAEAVDAGQGYLFARPLEVHAVDCLLADVNVPPLQPRQPTLVGGPHEQHRSDATSGKPGVTAGASDKGGVPLGAQEGSHAARQGSSAREC